jgi:hypothetical protein
MKPILEQVWEVGASGFVWRSGSTADLVHRPPDGAAAPISELVVRARIIAAALDMARALVAVHETIGSCDCAPGQDCVIAAALRKAGVL